MDATAQNTAMVTAAKRVAAPVLPTNAVTYRNGADVPECVAFLGETEAANVTVFDAVVSSTAKDSDGEIFTRQTLETIAAAFSGTATRKLPFCLIHNGETVVGKVLAAKVDGEIVTATYYVSNAAMYVNSNMPAVRAIKERLLDEPSVCFSYAKKYATERDGARVIDIPLSALTDGSFVAVEISATPKGANPMAITKSAKSVPSMKKLKIGEKSYDMPDDMDIEEAQKSIDEMAAAAAQWRTHEKSIAAEKAAKRTALQESAVKSLVASGTPDLVAKTAADNATDEQLAAWATPPEKEDAVKSAAKTDPVSPSAQQPSPVGNTNTTATKGVVENYVNFFNHFTATR